MNVTLVNHAPTYFKKVYLPLLFIIYDMSIQAPSASILKV